MKTKYLGEVMEPVSWCMGWHVSRQSHTDVHSSRSTVSDVCGCHFLLNLQ